MSLRNVSYFLVEAFKSLYRNSWLSIAAIGTIIVSLFILGASLLMVLNVNLLADSVESGVEISVFIQDDISGKELQDLGEQIKYLGGVGSMQFITRYQALEELKESFGDKSEALNGLKKNNTLPNSFRVKALSTRMVPSVAEKITFLDGVEKVSYGSGVVEKLMTVSSWTRTAGLVIVGLLEVAAIFLIATTIRLSVYARRKEIGIMKVLGATNWFIRMPFVLEGMVLGLWGGIIAAGLVYLGYDVLLSKVDSSLPFLQLVSDYKVNYALLGLTGLGFLIGIIGSTISVGKHLKV